MGPMTTCISDGSLLGVLDFPIAVVLQSYLRLLHLVINSSLV